jgi:4-amino-4-deoxy-L-arabinose transferase-like glycosyltransferase
MINMKSVKLNFRDPASALFLIFLILWAILSILQARFTPINSDEAYYWMYSRNLDWGFFDHPPMIALLIKIGYFFFKNELGVRLMGVLLQLLSFYLIWRLIDSDLKKKKENVLLLILIISSLPIFNIFGFIATPDSPLLFFTALFLFVYRKFEQNNTWKYAIFLGIVMAAIMYSKYHGALLIVFVILSNLKLLKNPKFYIAGVLALILFSPHMYWQYSNGFPSIKYHLVERVAGFSLKDVIEYFLNALATHNPLVFPVIIYLMFRAKRLNGFERTLYFVVIGFFAFFLISSFRYHVEPQWTAVASIPLVIILFNNLDYKPKISAYLKYATIISIVIILFLRSAMMIDFLPIDFFRTTYHGTKKWAQDIEKIAGNKPVVFTNSYQRASKYTFYTKKFSYTLNSLSYRKNQFDLWDFEEQLHGKEVLYAPHFLTDYYKQKLEKYITSSGDTIYARDFTDFQSLQKECIILDKNEYFFSKKEQCLLPMKLYNPYPYQINLEHPEFPVRFQVCFFTNGVLKYNKGFEFSEKIRILNVGDTIKLIGSFKVDDIPDGRYKLAICSESGIEYNVSNSKFKDVTIAE